MSSQIFPTRDTRNLLANAEALNLWTAGTNASVSANATTAPTGASTADRVDYTGGGGATDARLASAAVASPAPPGVLYTGSVYLKANTGATAVGLDLGPNSTAVDCQLSSSWARFSVSRIGGAAGGDLQLRIKSSSAGNAAFSVYAWGGQVELGGLSDYSPNVGDNSLSPYVLPGSFRRAPLYRTVIQSQDGGAEYRIRRAVVRYRYEMRLEGMPDAAMDTVKAFFDTHAGSWDRFQLEDRRTKGLVYVRFDQDELGEELDEAWGFWACNLSFISVV